MSGSGRRVGAAPAGLGRPARVAALYDIHGNLPALEAVLAEVEREDVDAVVVGGDVLPGPMPRETLALLRGLERPVAFIRGNGEREVLSVRGGAEPAGLPEPVADVLRWVAAGLTEEEEAALRAWPPTLRVEVAGVGSVLFCHATPESDSEIFTRKTPENALLPLFADVAADVVVCGHTHMAFDRRVGRVRVVNAGSVGMPFGEPGARWLLLGPRVEPRRTDYDLAAAAARIRATDYPQAETFAAVDVLRPRSQAEVLEAFERAAARRDGPAGR